MTAAAVCRHGAVTVVAVDDETRPVAFVPPGSEASPVYWGRQHQIWVTTPLARRGPGPGRPVRRDFGRPGVVEPRLPLRPVPFYLLRDGARVTVVDGLRRGFVLDTRSGAATEVVPGDVPEDFPEKSFGRFLFVSTPRRQYKWSLAEDLPSGAER